MGLALEREQEQPPAQPRAEGAVRIAARRRGAATRLAGLRQQGSAKALFPRGAAPMLETVILNTAGGITGGDRFEHGAEAEEGAWLSLSTQAAERAYRAQPGETGRLSVRLAAAAGARIDWLPQETILFDGAALSRRLEVDLAPDARLLAVEPLLFGRAAMGERLAALRFSDQWRVRRGGALVYADALRLDGTAVEILARPAVMDGAGAAASVLLVAPDAERFLDPVRARLAGRSGASLIRPGVLLMRMVAPGGLALRRALIPILEALREAPLPKVWTL